MRYAHSAAQIGSRKTATRAASGKRKRDQCGRKHQGGAKRRFIDERKAQAVKMRAEGLILSATVCVAGASAPTISKWGKKVAVWNEGLALQIEEHGEQGLWARKGLYEECEYAEISAGDSV